MKKTFSLALGLAFCLLLASCTTDSVNPLSSPDTAQPDQRLLGDWRGKKNPDKITFRFSMAKQPHWMHVEMIPDKAGEKTDAYDLFPTVIGDNTFLNVLTTGNDEQGHPRKSYTFVRYAVSSDHTLQMWMISQDQAAAAVRAGKIQGVVHENKHAITPGQPAHADVDVTFQDSSENLFKCVQNSDVDVLFNDKLETLYRVR